MRICIDESIFEELTLGKKLTAWILICRWLGIFDHRYGVELALKVDDYRHLIKFKKFMKTEAKIIKFNEKFYRVYRISIFSKKIAEGLINLGFTPNKLLILKFPSEDKVPSIYNIDFIRGYFEGDGCIYISKSLRGQP